MVEFLIIITQLNHGLGPCRQKLVITDKFHPKLFFLPSIMIFFYFLKDFMFLILPGLCIYYLPDRNILPLSFESTHKCQLFEKHCSKEVSLPSPNFPTPHLLQMCFSSSALCVFLKHLSHFTIIYLYADFEKFHFHY